jgi:hypothetical protein
MFTSKILFTKRDDITCSNLVTDAVHVFYIGELKVFADTKAHVMKAVMMNDD